MYFLTLCEVVCRLQQLRNIFLFLVAASIFTLVSVNIPLSNIFKVLGYTQSDISSQCPRTNLWRSEHRNSSTLAEQDTNICKPHIPHPDACREANKYYGNPTDEIENRKCFSGLPPSDICWFTNSTPAKFDCSLDFCEDSRIYMARIDHLYGVVKNWEPIFPFSTEKALKFVNQSVDQGETFCFIKCASIIRIIIFPPKVLVNRNVDPKKKININIVVLDCVSRPHFYRVMKRSVNALREVKNNDRIPATVLDFELFQSIDSHTMENIQPLFSGNVKAETPLGVDVLFKHFKHYGYQTMFQEDLCWFDSAGVMLDNLLRKPNAIPTIERWTRFKNIISKYHLDHVGITHFSCEVFREYGMTMMNDEPPQVCFNSRFFSSYHLNYIRSYIDAIRNTQDAAPLILYQHFNTAHTAIGTRVTNMDQEFANFIHFMARDENTWTILLSDHGHPRTPYGKTEEGLLERYHPFLFMIVPDNIALRFGKERMENLVSNQKRLLTTFDINRALMTLYEEQHKGSSDFRVSGVFSKIPSNRTCKDLPLMALARCQCEGTEEKLKDNSPSHTWLAEFAVGALNNLIQRQYSKGKVSKSTGVKGYGRCVRLIGKSFRRVLQQKSGALTTFDVHLDSSNVGLTEDEVFRVAVEFSKGVAILKRFDRQTLYKKFTDCVDESVELKLCSCDKRILLRNTEGRTLKTEEMKRLISSPMFGSRTEIKDLYDRCLLQVTRYHPNKISLAYEIANSCQGKTIKIHVNGSTDHVKLSRTLPMSFIAEPNTIHFMFSGAKQILNSDLNINVTATVM